MDVLFYTDAYAAAMTEFIRHVWDPDLTVEEFLRRRSADMAENPYGAEEGNPLAIVVDGSRIAGRLSAVPCRLWANGREYPMCWLSGLHVLPEYRGKGLAPLLPKLMIETYPLVTGFFVQEAPLRIYRKLGWTIAGRIPEYLKIIDARRFFRNFEAGNFDHLHGWKKDLARMLARTGRAGGAILPSFLLRCSRGIGRLRAGGKRPAPLTVVDEFDRRVDELWEKNKARIGCAQVRRAAYLNWRFSSRVGWIKVISEEDGVVRGYAILSIKQFAGDGRLRDMKVLSVIDVFWDCARPRVFGEMMDAIEEFARARAADMMLCSIHDAVARSTLKRRFYLRIPGTVYFGHHCARGDVALPPAMDGWFVTRGDADAAGSLAPS